VLSRTCKTGDSYQQEAGDAHDDREIQALPERVGRPGRPMTTWRQLLEGAGTANEVIAAARDFVAALDPARLAKLPPTCKPGKLMDSYDVAAYAYELARYHATDDEDVAKAIEELTTFFSRAAQRLSELATPSRGKVKLFDAEATD
jgi:hypothetical protein